MKKPPKPTPWRLQYQWKSPLDFSKYCIRAGKDEFTSKWWDGASRYVDLEHAKTRLYKEFVEPYYEAISIGRNWRIFNKETQEILTVIIENKTIILI